MNEVLPFFISKVDGAGNIFLCVDASPSSSFSSWEKTSHLSRPELAKRLCRFERLAADGLIFFHVGPTPQSLVWDFYNADGSGAEMCGNAARCAGLFAAEVFGLSGDSIQLLTGAGAVGLSALGHRSWAVTMPAISASPRRMSVKIEGQDWSGVFLNTGVPHFVIEDADLSPEECRKLRHHESFGAAGSNITLLRGFKAKTYERGVEDFTAACGTGAVAAAWVRLQGKKESVEIEMPGGKLNVNFHGEAPVLAGPAKWVCQIQIAKEILE